MIGKRRNLETSKCQTVETAKRRNDAAKVENGGRCRAVTHVLAVSFLALVAAGCNGQWRTATHIQTAKMEEGRNRFGAYSNNMVDNAILHDMSIADIHFIPHSSEISGLGEAALERFAPWLETYGATLRYETYLTDEELVVKRIAHAREYLELLGCDVDRISIRAMMSGGRVITAADAIRIMKAGTGSAAAGGRGTSATQAGTWNR